MYYPVPRPVLSMIVEFIGNICVSSLLSSLRMSRTYILVCSCHFSDGESRFVWLPSCQSLVPCTYSCFVFIIWFWVKYASHFITLNCFKHVLNVSNSIYIYYYVNISSPTCHTAVFDPLFLVLRSRPRCPCGGGGGRRAAMCRTMIS